MTSFVVMTPPARREKAFEEAVLIRDGFSFIAFLIPPIWLLWHRLWLEAAVAVFLLLACSVIATLLGQPLAGSFLSLLVSLYAGLEGQHLRALSLHRGGWREEGTIVAGSREEAEQRYAAGFAEDLAAGTEHPLTVPLAPASAAPRAPAPALGLLTYPGKS